MIKNKNKQNEPKNGIFISRKDEKRSCPICVKAFNTAENYPKCLMPCGHTFCDNCITKKRMHFCPLCKVKASQFIPDYEMIDMISGNTSYTIIPMEKKLEDLELSEEIYVDKVENNIVPQLKPEVKHLILEGTQEQQLIGTVSVRKLLSLERNPPIQEVIDSGIVPKLIEFLSSNSTELQFEAAWALTNILSGTSSQTNFVIQLGAVPILINMMSSEKEEIQGQVIWALGNVAGDDHFKRDMVLDNGILSPLIKILDITTKVEIKRNCVWVISNLCRGKPPPDLVLIEPAFPILSKILKTENDEEILIDTCWAISYICDGQNDRIQKVIENFDLKQFVMLVQHDSKKIKTPVLRIIGNIVTGDDLQTQRILDLDVIKPLKNLLKDPSEAILKEACWALSNITAGNVHQIQIVIDNEIFQDLIKLCETSTNKVKKEAIWALANATSGGTKVQIDYLFRQGTVKALINILEQVGHNDIEMMNVALEALINIAENYKNESNDSQSNNFTLENLFTEIETGIIESLANHSSQKIYEKSMKLLEMFEVFD